MARRKDQRPEVVLSRLGFVNLGINDIFGWDHFLRWGGLSCGAEFSSFSATRNQKHTPLILSCDNPKCLQTWPNTLRAWGGGKITPR